MNPIVTRISFVIVIAFVVVATLSFKPAPTTIQAQNEKGVTVASNVATLKAGFIFKRISKDKVEVGRMVEEPAKKGDRTPRRASYQRVSDLACQCFAKEIFRFCEVITSGTTTKCGPAPSGCKECTLMN